MSAMLSLRAWWTVRAALVAPPATPTMDWRRQTWLVVSILNHIWLNSFQFLFTLNTPAVHTISVKKAGKCGANISMNMAMSLRTSAKSLARNKQKGHSTSNGFMIMTRLPFFFFFLCIACTPRIPPCFGLRVQFTPGRRRQKLIMKRNFHQWLRSTNKRKTEGVAYECTLSAKRRWFFPTCRFHLQEQTLDCKLHSPCQTNVNLWYILKDHLLVTRWLWPQLLLPLGFQHRHLWERPEWLKSLRESWRKPERVESLDGEFQFDGWPSQ